MNNNKIFKEKFMNIQIKSHHKGYLLALFGGIILSFDTVLIRAIDFSPDQIAFWRSLAMSLPAIILILTSAFRKKNTYLKERICSRSVFCASFFYGLASILFPISAMTTSISNMLFIISTAPLWAAIFSWLVIRETVSRMTILGFIAALIGISIVMTGSAKGISVSFGDVTALITSMSMAAAFVVGRVSKKDLSLAPSIGAIIAAFILFFVFDIHLAISLQKLALVLLEGSVVIFLALTLIARSSNLIPSAHLSFFLLLETVLGPIWIWLVFGNRPTSSSLIGGAIILIGLIINSIDAIKQANTDKEQVLA